MPNLGDTKPCVLQAPPLGCDGTMTWKECRVPDAAFIDLENGSDAPEPLPEYQAWVCDKCQIERPE